MTRMMRRSGGNKTIQRVLAVASSGFVLILVMIYWSSLQSSGRVGQTEEVSDLEQETRVPLFRVGSINDIPYYHCTGSEKNLILLHGAAFSKEDWNTSGILTRLCEEDRLSVSALDLPVSAGHSQLKSILTKLEDSNIIQRPVILVTPSASGKVISDWVMTGDIEKIPEYISKWIPVATGSVKSWNENQLSSLKGKVPILAIYGNRDMMGKDVSERLATFSGASILEITGGHPAYLDSPEAFVEAILRDENFDPMR